MGEQILAAVVGHDEAIPFFGVEPLDYAGCHGISSNLKKRLLAGRQMIKDGRGKQRSTTDRDKLNADRVS
ncbi:hypothetical protein WJ971_16905 [Achromobacter xylosoxidans]